MKRVCPECSSEMKPRKPAMRAFGRNEVIEYFECIACGYQKLFTRTYFGELDEILGLT